MQRSLIEAVVEERGASYGDYAEQARIAQHLKDYFRLSPSWKSMQPHQRESLDMIACKISRILNGDPNHLDSWVDIAGYAEITRKRLLPYT